MRNASQIRISEQTLSPWVTLVARTVVRDSAVGPQVFHSLKQADYVSILAVTMDGRIPVVRQYRPTAQGMTMELPAGLLEEDETPEQCAVRELAEECGFALPEGATLEKLPPMRPDTGRLENTLWSFFVAGVTPLEAWTPEADVEMHLLTPDALAAAIVDGTFNHALHVAVVTHALLNGLVSLPKACP